MAYAQDPQDLNNEAYAPNAFGTAPPPSSALVSLTNIAGALLSVVLIAGLCVWGYRLVQRDVTGIPVVRAVAGEMRVRPADPGGQLATNQGLAVNAVAAQGATEAPADTLVLAPPPPDLSEDDLPTPTLSAAPVQQPEALDVAKALEAGDIDNLVARLTDGVEPIVTTEDDAAAAPVRTVVTPPKPAPEPKPAETVVANQRISPDVPGVSWSLRPATRPANAPAQVIPARAPVAVVDSGAKEIDAANIPTGTRLVQLGAYDSAETARKEWDRFNGRFADYMSGKDRVIQKAQSGGRTFYRLRAHGFADLSDARRFCAVLVAGKADCIPVVTR